MAKKFKFRLESVLKLRTEQVEEAKNNLNIAIRNRYLKEEEIDLLKNKKKDFLSQKMEYKIASEMQVAKDYIINIDIELQKKHSEYEKLLEIENQLRIKLNETLKEEKIILKLKEKNFSEYQQQVAKEETNFLDEIGTAQFIKNRSPKAPVKS